MLSVDLTVETSYSSKTISLFTAYAGFCLLFISEREPIAYEMMETVITQKHFISRMSDSLPELLPISGALFRADY